MFWLDVSYAYRKRAFLILEEEREGGRGKEREEAGRRGGGRGIERGGGREDGKEGDI